MRERGSKTSTVSVVWATFGIFSGWSKWFSVRRDWWPWTKPGYIAMTRRQSNNKWSVGIAAHPAQKNSECKNPLEKFSPRLFGIKTSSSSLSSKGPNYQRLSYLCRCTWRTFWRKNAAGRSPRWSCSCTTMPRLTGHLHPRRNWPIWASSVLITHPVLWIWPRWTTICSLDWKTIEKWPFFVRRRHWCCGDLVGRTTFWVFFFEWLAEVRAMD